MLDLGALGKKVEKDAAALGCWVLNMDRRKSEELGEGKVARCA